MPESASSKPRKAPSQGRSREMVETLLDATARILVQEGYAAASTNRIAEVAGVSVGSLYQYFPNKSALVTALRHRHARQMRDILLKMAGDSHSQTIAASVKNFVHALLAAHQIDPALHRVLHEEVPRPAMQNPDTDFESEIRAAICALLVARQGEILPTEASLAALVLVRSVEALVHTAVIHPAPNINAEHFEQEIVNLIMRYLQGSGWQA